MSGQTTLKLSLSENAFDSLNESLACVEQAESDSPRWKFAVLNLTHALELLLKHRLRLANDLLIWENVDRPGKTVSLEKAVQRLMRLQLGVDESDQRTIAKAQSWRNNITHYEVDLVLEEVRDVYLLTFEFFDRFLKQELNESLSERVHDRHLPTATRLMKDFAQEFLTFRGREMHRRWPRLLVAAQAIPTLFVGEAPYQRIRWGGEAFWTSETSENTQPPEFCIDCATAVGDYHGPLCESEQCPRCGGQLLSCSCPLEGELWSLDDDAWTDWEQDYLTAAEIERELDA